MRITLLTSLFVICFFAFWVILLIRRGCTLDEETNNLETADGMEQDGGWDEENEEPVEYEDLDNLQLDQRSETIIFCRECNNMLYPKENKRTRKLEYTCRVCPHKELAKYYCVHSNKIVQTITEIMTAPQGMSDDPTLPRISRARCPKCPSRLAVFWPEIPRHRDGQMEMFFECCKCQVQWSSGSMNKGHTAENV